MPRFRLTGRRFWSNRRRRRTSPNNESSNQEDDSAANETPQPSQTTPEMIASDPLIHSPTINNDTTIQRADTDPSPIRIPIIEDSSDAVVMSDAAGDDTNHEINEPCGNHDDEQYAERLLQEVNESTSSQVSPSQGATVMITTRTSRASLIPSTSSTTIRAGGPPGPATVSWRRRRPSHHSVSQRQSLHEVSSSIVRPSQGTTEFIFDDPHPDLNPPPRSPLQRASSTRLYTLHPSAPSPTTATTTTQLPDIIPHHSYIDPTIHQPPTVVTVLLRESEGEPPFSRLLGATVRSPLVHQPRRYHFIWSSDGTDNQLWSSPIRLRSYLSQFCTAMSRRVIPHGASIEVVLYPNILTSATAPGFIPMSITRLYCMIHPIHPPTSWQTQFPTDFAGNWSSFISDIGMNALAGPLLEAPIPTSLPDHQPLVAHPPPPPSPLPPPTIPLPDHTNTNTSTTVSSTDVQIDSPNIESQLSAASTSSSLSHIISGSSLSSQSLSRTDSNGSTNTNDMAHPPPSPRPLSPPPGSLSLPTTISVADNQHQPLFRFPNLPGKGCHEYNLFVPPSYILGPVIGEGEFAKVRMACNLVTNGAVAIKAFRRRRGALSSSIDEQIMREVNVLKGLRCRNIVKVFESLVHGDRFFMVMEIMTKGDLRKYINKTGAMKESNARKMFADVLNGVVYLHQNRIVHLDLKLENLLLNEDLVIKITDFGCARIQVGQKRFNTPCGSYAYGAPEVISGQTYDGMKADMWSLGIILYCMVSARLPYADDGQLAELIWERRQSPDVPSWVSVDCGKLIKSSLRYRPERRLTEVQVMTHPWMWAECKRLPWSKPYPLKKRRDASSTRF